MIVVVTKQFEKDVKKELSKSYQQQLAGILEKLQEANSIKEVSNIRQSQQVNRVLLHRFYSGKFLILSFNT